MKDKISKIIGKTIVLLPFGLSFWILINGFDLNNWGLPVIAGFVISFGIVFLNLFDYEKYDDMDKVDFLESKHILEIEINSKNWNSINEMIETPFVKLKVLEKTENNIKVQIHGKILDSILTAKKSQNEILVEIENKYLNFIPDKAHNYAILKKIETGL
jgi:hypothetical protein